MSKPLSKTAACDFTRKVVSHFLGTSDAIGEDLTYEDFTDIAAELGIVVTVAFDPAIHAECAGADECDINDPIVVPAFNDYNGDDPEPEAEDDAD